MLINKTLGCTRFIYNHYLDKKQTLYEEKGSHNYYKLKIEIVKLYRKIKNTRKYIIHKITEQIIENNDIIVNDI